MKPFNFRLSSLCQLVLAAHLLSGNPLLADSDLDVRSSEKLLKSIGNPGCALTTGSGGDGELSSNIRRKNPTVYSIYLSHQKEFEAAGYDLTDEVVAGLGALVNIPLADWDSEIQRVMSERTRGESGIVAERKMSEARQHLMTGGACRPGLEKALYGGDIEDPRFRDAYASISPRDALKVSKIKEGEITADDRLAELRQIARKNQSLKLINTLNLKTSTNGVVSGATTNVLAAPQPTPNEPKEDREVIKLIED